VLYLGPVRRVTARGSRSLRRLLTLGSGTHILPGIERGAQAGIESASGAWVTQQIGCAKAVRNMSTQLHSRMCRPAGGLPSRHSHSLATREGDTHDGLRLRHGDDV